MGIRQGQLLTRDDPPNSRPQRNATINRNETSPADREAIRAELEQEYRDEMDAERAKVLALQKEAQADRDKAKAMLQGITPIMTQEEFKMIRSLLHPDRHPEDSERYNRAFEIFNRLLTTIDPNIPIAVKRKRGWA